MKVEKTESLEVYRKRLTKGPKAKGALAQLRRLGFDKKEVARLVDGIASVPLDWSREMGVTKSECLRRRKSVSRSLERVADVLDADPILRHEGLLPHRMSSAPEIKFESVCIGLPSMAQVIRAIAKEIVTYHEWHEEMLIERRQTLQTRCLWYVFWQVVKSRPGEKRSNRRSPNLLVEHLVGLLLNKKIPKDTMSHVLGPDHRRKYTKE